MDYELSKDKRFIIHRLRKCPACHEYHARVERSDRDKKPIMRCLKCGRTFACCYADDNMIAMKSRN